MTRAAKICGRKENVSVFPIRYSASFFVFFVPGFRPRFFGVAVSEASVVTSVVDSAFFLVALLAAVFLTSVPSPVAAALFLKTNVIMSIVSSAKTVDWMIFAVSVVISAIFIFYEDILNNGKQ